MCHVFLGSPARLHGKFSGSMTHDIGLSASQARTLPEVYHWLVAVAMWSILGEKLGRLFSCLERASARNKIQLWHGSEVSNQKTQTLVIESVVNHAGLGHSITWRIAILRYFWAVTSTFSWIHPIIVGCLLVWKPIAEWIPGTWFLVAGFVAPGLNIDSNMY